MAHYAFKGSRLKFLMDNLPGYAKALKEGWAADFLADLVRRYFKRYPPGLDHSEEPSREHLEQVNDDEPDPEVLPPVRKDGQSVEEFQAALVEFEKLQKVIDRRICQIRRWMSYHHSKENPKKDPGEWDPWAAFLAKLSGVPVDRPGRQRTAYNRWAMDNKEKLDPLIKAKVATAVAEAKAAQTAGADIKKSGRKGPSAFVKIRQDVIIAEFEKLPEAERIHWKDVAESDHRVLTQKWHDAVNKPVDTSPEARQACIENIAAFVMPFLNGLSERTGWNATIIMGGPEPADDGRLNIYARWNAVGHATAFLKDCFPVAECQARRLSQPAPTLASLGVEEGIDHHRVDDHVGGAQDNPLPTTSAIPTPTSSSATTTSLVSTTNTSSGPSKALAAATSNASKASTSKSIASNAKNGPSTATPAPTMSNVTTAKSAQRKPTATQPLRAVLVGPSSVSSRRSPPPPVDSSSPEASPCLSPPPLPLPIEEAHSVPLHRSPLPQQPSFSSSPEPPAAPLSPTLPPMSASSRGTSIDPMVDLDASDDEPLGVDESDKPKKRGRAASRTEAQVSKKRKSATGTSNKSRGRTKFVPYVAVPSLPSIPVPVQDDSRESGPNNSMDVGEDSFIHNADLEATAHQVTCPPNAAQYVQRVVEMVNAIGMDPKLCQIVTYWLSIDGKAHWDVSITDDVPNKLTTKDRPPAVGRWISVARPATFKAKIVDLDQYATKFISWFSECSPEWRQREAGTFMMSRDGGSDWSAIAVTGVNGIVSIVAALAWWKEALNNFSQSTSRQQQTLRRHYSVYEQVLDEVLYTFQNVNTLM
ncbi:SERTA domain-containing protein 3 [Paramarasmius palmivorus]|uniref:SERTA domain-containing protein 3 n=1 Tax=Paramarasmius palmivorus TaxID=297713 RepID=A0AAW0BD28_9AGAR